jgi:hypothetical protein
MKQTKLNEAVAAPDAMIELPEAADNVLDFSATLRELRKSVDPEMVRHRAAHRDRNGNVRMVEYVEWHTVADVLDETAPNWIHEVKNIRRVGDIITVTVAITIDGITREGIGTGRALTETGIKKAEHDALKRAAVKFGIARELYKREFDSNEQNEFPASVDHSVGTFSGDPIAKSLGEMVTAKQLGMIRAIARETTIDADAECTGFLGCRVDELSKRAASEFIDHLQGMQRDLPASRSPMRRAG